MSRSTQIPSARLTNFFLDFDLVSQVSENSTLYYYEEVKIEAGGRTILTNLRYKKEFGPIGAVLGEVKGMLHVRNHYVDTDIVRAFVILFGLADHSQRTSSLINQYFSCIGKVRLKQYLFFLPTLTDKVPNLTFFDFSIGEVDYARFTRFIETHAGSDFADKYKNQLKNKLVIEIKNHEVLLMDCYKWLEILKLPLTDLPLFRQELINNYLTPISRIHYDGFKKKFTQQLQFVKAFYGVSYELDELEKYGFTFVNVYYGFLMNPSVGWVLPVGSGAYTIFLPDTRILTRTKSFLGKNKEILSENKGPFYQFFSTMSYLFSNSQTQIDRGNLNEAFIGFFAGLDFFLAPHGEPSKKLKQRMSILTYKFFGCGFIDHLADLDRLYNARSEFVHSGKDVNEEDLIKLRTLSRAVLNVCLQLHAKNRDRNRITHLTWIAKLDEYIQKEYRGIRPTPREWINIGVTGLDAILIQAKLNRYDI